MKKQLIGSTFHKLKGGEIDCITDQCLIWCLLTNMLSSVNLKLIVNKISHIRFIPNGRI